MSNAEQRTIVLSGREVTQRWDGLAWVTVSDKRHLVLAGHLMDDCPICYPLGCDDPDAHLGVPSEYTPLKNRGCRCGADLDGRDCMCFEND